MINQIPKNWQKVKLGEVVNVYGGGTPSTQNQSYWNGDIPWLTPAELTNAESRSTRGTASYITPAGLQNSSARVMPENSILLTSRATIGNATINTVPMATNQGFINIEPRKVDRDFFYYWLKDKKKYLNQIAVGSTFPELSKSVFKEIETELPATLQEQTQIASILSSFDDKIEVNNKIAKTLEEMAQALFKEWFVHFRFPGYKKAEFVDSELGKIPRGWRVKKFGDLVRVDRGVSYSGAGLNNNGLPMINLGCFLRGGIFSYANLKFYNGNYRQSQLVETGDIVIANTDITQDREIIGNPAIVFSVNGINKFLFTHHVFAIRNNSGYSNQFFYFLLRTSTFRGRAAGFATGTNVLALPKDALLQLQIALPPPDLVVQFSDFADNTLRQRIIYQQENQKLAALRDLLLPKLMKGEIRA